MAFTSAGLFGGTQKATEELTPLEQLALVNKKKTTGGNASGTSTVGTANVLAPTNTTTRAAAVTPTVEEAVVPALIDGAEAQNLGETFDEYKERTEDERSSGDMPEQPANITPKVYYISTDPESPYYWATLGYPDETWAGLPYEQGYWQEQEDGTSVWIQTRDLTGQAQQLYDLQNSATMPASPELIDVMGSAEYAAMQDLIALLSDPNTTAADKDAGIAQFEANMGLAPGEWSTMLGDMLEQLNQGVYAQQGMSQEDQAAFNRETQLNLQRQRDDFQLMLEALGAQGRSVAGFQMMDNIALSMSTYESQRAMERINTDLAMRETEYEALRSRWETLYNAGEMSAQQYIENVTNNRTLALQGYAQEISTMFQQNAQDISLYEADIAAAQAHAQIVYQGIMADIGVSEAVLSDMQAHYEMYMAPYYAELERWALEQQVKQSDQAAFLDGAGLAVGAAATGALIGSTIPGVGTLIGGVIGLIGGGIAALVGGSAVCTELCEQGRISEETLSNEYLVLKMTTMLNPDVYDGYKDFAKKFVPIMKKSKIISKITSLIVKRWIKEMEHKYYGKGKGSIPGKMIDYIGRKIFSKTGGYHG